MIRKFESFDNDLEGLRVDVEILMEDLIDSLGLKRYNINDDWVNGYYDYKVVMFDSVVYNFAMEDPFDTAPSNSFMMKSTIEKLGFIQSLVGGISKVTARLDKFGYRWDLISCNGSLSFYIHKKIT